MANKRITALTEVTAADPDDVVELDGVTNSRQIKVRNLVAATPPPPTETPPSGNFLKSGGSFSHTTGLNIAVGAAEFYIQGVLSSTAAAIVTAGAADATNPRIDAVVLTSSGPAIVAGTAAASPVRPTIDPATQLELTFITIAALATTPTIAAESIYLENTEWTTTASTVRIDPVNTGDPYAGTKSIKFIVAISGDYIKFVDSPSFLLETYELLTMWVTPVTWVSQKSITLQCYLAGVAKGNAVSLRDGVFGLVRTTTTDQIISIPTKAFGVAGILIDEIRQTVAGGSTGLTAYIDNIVLQAGIAANGTSDRLRDRGLYDPAKTYSYNDLAYEGTIIYRNISGSFGILPSTGTSNWVVFANRLALGSALQVRRMNAAGTAEEFVAPSSGGTGYILIQDQKSAGTNGGTFNSGAWRTRDLNTEVSDSGNFASVSSNQITLLAGTYRIRAYAPAMLVDSHVAKLYNVTDAVDTVLGMPSYSVTLTNSAMTQSVIEGRFTISGTKVFEIRHRSTGSGPAYSFGAAANVGIIEVYTSVTLERES